MWHGNISIDTKEISWQYVVAIQFTATLNCLTSSIFIITPLRQYYVLVLHTHINGMQTHLFSTVIRGQFAKSRKNDY
jgi:hypothetical protein